jgi:hypothetical protein
MRVKHRFAAIALLMAVVGLPFSAFADGSDAPAVFVTKDNAWSFEVVPYAWLPGLKGTVDIRNYSVGIDQSFSDIFKTLKFAADGLAIARYNDWLIYTQVDYFNLSTTQLNNPPARGSFDTKETFYTVAAGQRFNGWKSGLTFDVLIGAQGLNIDNTLTFYRLGSVQRTRDNVDVIVMLRPSFQFSQHWLLNPTFSGGGGGSNSTYQLQPQVQYQFNSTWELRFGWRKMWYGFSGPRNGNNSLEFALAGPLIGFGATF